MAFCPNCGAEVQGRFCARCGTAMPDPARTAEQAYSNPGQVPPGAQPYGQRSAGGMSDNLAGALSYVLGLITGVLFLVLSPYSQSKFVRFHAFQAIFFHLAAVALSIVLTMLGFILPAALMVVLSLIWMLISLAGLVVWIILMVKAYNGEKFRLPVIGDLADKQA